MKNTGNKFDDEEEREDENEDENDNVDNDNVDNDVYDDDDVNNNEDDDDVNINDKAKYKNSCVWGSPTDPMFLGRPNNFFLILMKKKSN